MEMGPLVVLTSLFMLAMVGLPAPSGTVQAQDIQSFEMSELTPSEATADVIWGTVGKTQFSGSVMVERGPVGDVRVTLTPYCSESSWTVMAYPNIISFDTSATRYFSILVSIPMYTTADVKADIEVHGVAEFHGGETIEDHASAVAGIRPVYSANIVADPAKGTKNPQNFNIKVTNFGNIKDTFDIDIANRDKLERDGFDLDIRKVVTRALIPRDWDSTILEVSYDRGTGAGSYKVELVATSNAAMMRENLTVTSTLELIIVVETSGLTGLHITLLLGVLLIMAIMVAAVAMARRRRGRPRKKGPKAKGRQKK